MKMAYCTAEDVLKLIKLEMLSSIIGEEFESDLEILQQKIGPMVQDAISDAGAEIDGYLAKRYNLPFLEPPRVLNKLAKDIAVYNLLSRRGIEKDSGEVNYLSRYNAAIKFLTSVANGLIELGIVGSREAAANGFRMRSCPRNFTRDRMKGW